MKDEIIAQLNQYITGQILKRPDKTLNPNEPLISGGLIDSFSLVDLSLFVEQTWAVRLDDTELNAQTFDTLNQLADLIQTRIK
ncbi:MAG: acyl carrier protein [Anaerolineales bacterium]